MDMKSDTPTFPLGDTDQDHPSQGHPGLWGPDLPALPPSLVPDDSWYNLLPSLEVSCWSGSWMLSLALFLLLLWICKENALRMTLRDDLLDYKMGISEYMMFTNMMVPPG